MVLNWLFKCWYCKAVSSLRFVKLRYEEIKDFKISSKAKDSSLKDQDVISILKKMNKQRNDSCIAYKKAGRDDLLKKEEDEISIINNFLPKQMSEEESKKICKVS